MDEYDKAEVEEGWTLEEALEDVRRNSDQWHEYRDILKDIEFAKNRKTDDNEKNQRPAIRHSMWSEIQSARLVILANPQNKLDRLNRVFRSELDSLLAEGHYVAFGKVDGISEPYNLIELSYWPTMKIILLEPSVVQERTQAKTEWLGVRVFVKGEEPQPIGLKSPDIDQSSIAQELNDPTEPPPIPPFPKFSGEETWDAIICAAKAHPDRFVWAYDQPKFKGKFAVEVAEATGCGVERCRTLIRERKPRILKIISEVNSIS